MQRLLGVPNPFGRWIVFIHLQVLTFWHANCEYQYRKPIGRQAVAMLEESMNVLTDTLIDMLVAILVDHVALTANDAANDVQIQRELQRRHDEQHWGFLTVNWEICSGGLS
jgi:hypothetical protein